LVLYSAIVRIQEVAVVHNDYCLSIVDESAKSRALLPRRLFSSRKADAELRELEFEESSREGHPFFRILLKEGESGGKPAHFVEHIERVRDYNLVTYHNLKIMEMCMQVLQSS
jgi:hypothetical protein